MKKGLAVILALALLLGICSAAADVDIDYEGTAYHLVCDSVEVGEDGVLTVKVSGFGSRVAIKNGQMVAMVWAVAVYPDGAEEEAESVRVMMGSEVTYGFTFKRGEMPESVLLYPAGEKDNRQVLWQAGQEAGAEPAAESAAAPGPVAWKDYQVYFPYMTTDMTGYGLVDFTAVTVLVRVAPTEGTIAYKDFSEKLFVLRDPDGNEIVSNYFILANMDENSFLKTKLPSAQQEYVDILYAMPDPTPERLDASVMLVYQEAGGEATLVPLAGVPQTLE